MEENFVDELLEGRKEVANHLFMSYDFGRHITITHSGWERTETDTWTSKVSFEQESYAFFTIQFEPDSIKTKQVSVSHVGQCR